MATKKKINPMTYDLIHQVTYQRRTGSVAVDKNAERKWLVRYYDSVNGTIVQDEWIELNKDWWLITRATKSLQLPVDELVMPEKENKIITDHDLLLKVLRYQKEGYGDDRHGTSFAAGYRLAEFETSQSAGCYTREDIVKAIDMATASTHIDVDKIINSLHPLPKTLTIEDGRESWGW